MKYLLCIFSALALFCLPAMTQTVITPSATPTFHPGSSLGSGIVKLFTYVPAQSATFNAQVDGMLVGSVVRLEITSAGTTSWLLTFNQNFSSIGTLQTGTTAGIIWILDFYWDGVSFREISRQRQTQVPVTIPVVATTSTLPYSDSASYYVFTPTAAVNLAIDNAGRQGAIIDILLVSDTTGRTVTLSNTGSKICGSGTIATGATTNSMLRLISDGSVWRETSRITAQAATAP